MSQKQQDNANRRQLYRLRFPAGEELSATVGGLTFKVAELSERGIRLISTKVPHRSGICQGILYLSNGTAKPFYGELGRVDGGEQVILGVTGIAMADVVAEQLRLRRKKLQTKQGDD
jgi:hypothetical protein